jgi:probable phosphoglycerate mutase
LSTKAFAGVWSSDLIRAISTARLSYGEPALDARLREMHFGDLEEMRWDVVDSKYRDAITEFKAFQAPNGEDIETFKDRVFDFVSFLPSGRHLIFTHGGVIRILTQDLGLRRFVPNATLVVVDWTQRRLVLTEPPLDS